MGSFGKSSTRIMVLDETIFDSFSFEMLHSDQRAVKFKMKFDALALDSWGTKELLSFSTRLKPYSWIPCLVIQVESSTECPSISPSFQSIFYF